jgi:signal peptidase I
VKAAAATPTGRDFTEADALKIEMAAELVRKFGAARFRALGFSMAPALRPGDILDICRVSPEEISVGQIIAFTAGNGRVLTTHRVVAVIEAGEGDGRGRRWIARGDRAATNDAPVFHENLIGVVSAVTRRMGPGGREIRFAPRPRLTWMERILLALALRRSEKATALFLRWTHPARAYRRAGQKWSEEAVVWQP